ncbi:MAG TPA: YceI family protein [Bacteroidales bacterium]|nr:YceI family protein [Bacteroidales bacterium]
MKRIVLILLLLPAFTMINAQKYITKNGFIGFFSHTPMEDIKADNNQVASILDSSTGDIVFQVLVKSFHFDRALMEEHFNENYMESEKFPKASFKGKVTNLSSADLKKKGTYNITAEGDLTIHGVTNKVKVDGTLEVTDGGLNASAKFGIIPEDYKITIPGLVREKIEKSLAVTVTMKYNQMQ